MQRKVIAEMLDEDGGSPADVAASFIDLKHINDWFGGTRTTIELLGRVASEARCRQLSVLEVGSGTGDVPLAAQRKLASRGIELRMTLLDRMWSHLPINGVAAVAGDALKLPFRDDTFDVVSCSLFAHHLEPGEMHDVGAGSIARVPASGADQRLDTQPPASGAGLCGPAALSQPDYLA